MMRDFLIHGINGALAGLVVFQLVAPLTTVPETIAPSLQPAAKQTNLDVPQIDPTNIPARSLFRRVPLPIQAPAPEPPPVLPPVPPPVPPAPPREAGLRLVGLLDRNGTSWAFIWREGDRDIHRLGLGDRLDGWVLGAISPRVITLRRNGEERSLALDPPSAP